MRRRLDDLFEGRISKGTDNAWMKAQFEAFETLQRAEAVVFGGSDIAKQQTLRDLVTEMNRRTGRHPDTVTTERLREFVEALKALL